MKFMKHNIDGKYYLSWKLDEQDKFTVLDPQAMRWVQCDAVADGVEELRSPPSAPAPAPASAPAVPAESSAAPAGEIVSASVPEVAPPSLRRRRW